MCVDLCGRYGEKFSYFDAVLLFKLGLAVDTHGKMQDVSVSNSKSGGSWGLK
jgi:hypothetical protein